MNQPIIKSQSKPSIFALILLCLTFNSAGTAQAVIPQLLGPLSALLSVIPQLLAVVGIAVLTVVVFARDWLKGLFYRIRESVFLKTTTLILLLAIVGGGIWVIYSGLQSGQPYATTTEEIPREKQSVKQSWSAFRGGVTRTGVLDNLPGPTNPTVSWLFKGTGGVVIDFSSSPAVVGSQVYIAAAQGSLFSSGGAVYCLDANSGVALWRYDTPVQIFSSPTVAGGRVYVGEGFHQDADCQLHCIDANDGRAIWTVRTTSHVESTPFVSQGKVYFGAGNDGVYCVDALEGKQIWHYPSVHVDMSPVVWKGKVYFGAGYGEYRIYAVDANSGEEVWSKRVDYPAWGSPSADGDTVFFGLGNGNFIESAAVPQGRVTAHNAGTGEQIWEYEAEDSVLTAVAYRNGFVYFGSRDGNVYALNATNGTLRWKSRIGSPVVSSPAVTESAVYAGANNGVIYRIDIGSGNVVWQVDTDRITGGGPIYSSPAIANGKLYIGLKDYLLCLGGEEMIHEMLEQDDQ